MSDERDVTQSLVPVESFSSNLPVTRDMLNSLTEQRSLLKEFVSKQLHKDIDFGVVPGTKKPSLFKPGAEKLRSLFGLTIRLSSTNQTIDRNGNFAMFTYKASVYRGENLIAECEGSTNSQEKKYRERQTWVYNEKTRKKEPQTEITPVCDILNTLQKMAQKRSFVGAIILAVGASDFFNQDIDDLADARSVGIVPDETKTPSAIPSVVNVSSTPKENNQQGPVWVEALTDFGSKHLAKDAGFKWDKDQKKWLKQIQASEMNSFPFEVRAV